MDIAILRTQCISVPLQTVRISLDTSFKAHMNLIKGNVKITRLLRKNYPSMTKAESIAASLFWIIPVASSNGHDASSLSQRYYSRQASGNTA